MSQKAVIAWRNNYMRSFKRDLLFFDEFYYDPWAVEMLLAAHEKLESLHPTFQNLFVNNEVIPTIDFLTGKGLLKPFKLEDWKNEEIKMKPLDSSKIEEIMNEIDLYNKAHVEIHEQLDKASNQFEILQGILGILDFFDYQVRLEKMLIENSIEDFPVTAIVENLDCPYITNENKDTVLKVTINNLPVPDDITPFDEIIDFKADNKLQYLGLVNWMNKISKSRFNQKEIEQEIEFLTLAFEDRMKLEKQKYRLVNLESIISLPIEIIEHLLKIRWSQIPKSLFQMKITKINLLTAETTAPGREMSYLVKAAGNFGKK